MNLLGRLEFKGERTSNDRCFANQLYSLTFRCASQITPQLDFQFSLRSLGAISDRVRVDVDYDSQREFDGSNNISLAYRGREGDLLERVEIGNVTFRAPASRFLTSGIPSGNYGIQASGRLGPLRFSAIAAQQRGNVLRDTVFTVGGRASRIPERTIHDYQVESRRFFFTVDPALFASRWPNVDILDASQMAGLAASLPETQRPLRVSLYRLIIGGQPPNPNGPQFSILGDPDSRPGQVYEHLREGVDYYIDPSQLWIALVRPLSLANERLVAAWTLRVGGRDTVIATLGGTPDLEFTREHPQYAHLLWQPGLEAADPAFRHEIRSVYRLGGDDIRRETVSLRIVAGTSGAPVCQASRAAPSRSEGSIQPDRERLPSGKIPTSSPASSSACARAYASRPLPCRTSTGKASKTRSRAPRRGTRNSASQAMKWTGLGTRSDSSTGSR